MECYFGLSKNTVVKRYFGPSKSTVVECNFGPSKITVVDRNFRLSKITMVDNCFGPSKITVLNPNFGLFFWYRLNGKHLSIKGPLTPWKQWLSQPQHSSPQLPEYVIWKETMDISAAPRGAAEPQSYETQEQASAAPRLCLNTPIFSRLQAGVCYFFLAISVTLKQLWLHCFIFWQQVKSLA